MVAQVKDVKAKIEIVEAATQRKQVFLDGLRGQLDQIEASTSGLQSHMQTPVTATLKLQHEASAALAAPLYTLFCELQAYQKASGCAKQMQVSIVDAKGLGSKANRVKKREFPGALLAGGRVHTDSIEPPPSKRLKAPSRSPSVAKQRESGKTPSRSPSMSRTRPGESSEILVGDAVAVDKEEEGAVAEPTSRGMPTLIIKEMSEVKIANDDDNEGVFDEDRAADSQPKELWKCADKAVQLTLSLAVDDDVEGAETKEFAVLFQYFPTAQIVTAELVTPSSGSLGKHVLTSLFPGDDGLQLSNHATAYKFTSEDEAQSEISFPFELTASRPYLWAQWICGLHALPRSDANDSQRRTEPSVRNVIQQLIRRLAATTQLKRHLGALAKGNAHAPVHASFARHFPTTIKTKLSGWKEIAHPTADTRDLFKTHASTGSQYFSVAFKNDKLHVDAVIEVSPEYPVRAPQFRLRHGESTATVDNALKVGGPIVDYVVNLVTDLPLPFLSCRKLSSKSTRTTTSSWRGIAISFCSHTSSAKYSNAWMFSVPGPRGTYRRVSVAPAEAKIGDRRLWWIPSPRKCAIVRANRAQRGMHLLKHQQYCEGWTDRRYAEGVYNSVTETLATRTFVSSWSTGRSPA
jgi:hypothetical protein